MRLTLILLFCAVASFVTFAAEKPDANILDRWVGGKWVGDGQFLDTAYSQAAKVGGVTTCSWSPDHIFVTCDQDVHFGDAPMRDLSIYAFDSKTSQFHFYSVTPAGDRPHTGSLDISADGAHWVYLGSAEISGKTVQFRTTNEFHWNDQVDWWSEASGDDGKTWTRTASGKETRQR
jgi:hypothetical protein